MTYNQQKRDRKLGRIDDKPKRVWQKRKEAEANTGILEVVKKRNSMLRAAMSPRSGTAFEKQVGFSRKLNKQCGFSLVEAMVASVILAIGFVGVFSLNSVAMTVTDSALIREQMQQQAIQMLDVIEADQDNLASYDLNLTACNAPAVGEEEIHDVRRYEWCRRLNDRLGDAQTGDVREIDVVDLGSNRSAVTVELGARAGGVVVLVKRSFGG